VLPPGSESAITNERFLKGQLTVQPAAGRAGGGTEASYFTIKKFNVERGRAFGPQEVSVVFARRGDRPSRWRNTSSRGSTRSVASCA
jgi:hypothetical protein